MSMNGLRFGFLARSLISKYIYYVTQDSSGTVMLQCNDHQCHVMINRNIVVYKIKLKIKINVCFTPLNINLYCNAFFIVCTQYILVACNVLLKVTVTVLFVQLKYVFGS